MGRGLICITLILCLYFFCMNNSASLSPTVTVKGGFKVSKLGIGCWAWGDKFFWKYDQDEDSSLQKTFNYCIEDAGINLFDTAEIYGLGRSELLLSRFSRQLKPEVEVKPFLASKFAPLPWRLGSDSVVNACQESLDRMGVDSMDLYQLHWPSKWQEKAYWKGIAECYDRGMIKSVGVSNYGPDRLKKVHSFLKERGVPLAFNQVQFSLLCRNAETEGLLSLSKELGVSTLGYSPLAQGILTGKFSDSNLPQGPRSTIVRSTLPKVQTLLATMKDIAETESSKLGTEITLSQVAINWCIAKGTIPIPGARNVKQAQDNCNSLSWELSSEDIANLDRDARNSKVNLITPLQSK